MWATRTHRRQSTSSFNPCLTAYAQERENFAPSTCRSKMRAPRSKLRAVAHTVEDAEGLLNSLLLLTVLMLAFAVNQTTAIFSLEDFLEADKREARSYWNLKGRPEIIKDGAWGRGPISHFFIIMQWATQHTGPSCCW